jgi:hypothetical protein
MKSESKKKPHVALEKPVLEIQIAPDGRPFAPRRIQTPRPNRTFRLS